MTSNNYYRKIRIRCILFVSLLSCNYIFAQHHTVSGMLLDGKGKPASMASIKVWNDSAVIKMDYVREDGSFSVPLSNGRYRFQFSSLGVTGVDTTLVVNANVNMGNLLFQPIHQLGEVVVKSSRPVVSLKTDRIYYNVGNDRYTSGLNGFDVMARAPRLFVDKRNKTVSMIGRKGVKVLLNGRAVEDGDAMERLRTIPSENIERIEIIPIPPSRYSAEGDIGLVNVVLKKDPTHGVSGDMRLWGQQNHHSQTSFTGNLNYRSKKWEIKVGASPYVGQYMNASTQEYTYKDGKSFQYQEYHPAYRGFYTNEIVKFKPNNNMELGAILSHTTQDNNTGYDGTIDLLGAEPNSSIATWSHVKLHTLNTNLSAYADVNLDSLGKKLSFTYNLTRKKNATHSDMSSTQSGKIDATQSDFDNHYLVHSGLIDVELPFRTFKMETGVSGLFINNDSYNNLFNINNGIATPNADQTNNFKYKEQTFGAYVSASAQLGKHWSAKAGLRYEHTHTEGFSPTMNSLVKKNYGDLFPTAYLSWNPNNKNTFSLSYARRINRPYFTALNPFRMYITANAYSSGSPDLKPVISNTVELTYNYAGRLNFTIWHGQIKNVITDVKKMTEDGMTVSTIQNTFDSSEFGLGINYMRSLFTWCSLNLGTNLHYQHQTVSDPSLNIKNTEGFGGRMFAMADFTLNKSKTLFSGISFFQFLPTVDGLAYTRGSANVNVYITYNIIKDKLKMNLSASDIFKQSFTTRKYYYTEYKLRDKFFYDARCVELSFTYFFGKKKVNSVYKQTKDVLNGRAY